MEIDFVRRVCLSFPHATEQIQWGHDLVFKIGGKMFAVMPTEVAPVILSFKCDHETFAELCERPGIIPAPYMARAQWVALEPKHPLSKKEMETLLRRSYDLVFAKLTKKDQARLEAALKAGAAKAKSRRARRKR